MACGGIRNRIGVVEDGDLPTAYQSPVASGVHHIDQVMVSVGLLCGGSAPADHAACFRRFALKGLRCPASAFWTAIFSRHVPTFL